jgi:hypothetical protein
MHQSVYQSLVINEKFILSHLADQFVFVSNRSLARVVDYAIDMI